MERKLIYIDIENDKCLFYEISMRKEGKKNVVVGTSGKIGNKGTSIIVFEDNDYEKAKSAFWEKVNLKKKEGYKFIDDVQLKINSIFDIKTCQCDMCKKAIQPELYEKINKYLRNESKVDENPESPGYKKVLCFDCQKKHGIYVTKKTEK